MYGCEELKRGKWAEILQSAEEGKISGLQNDTAWGYAKHEGRLRAANTAEGLRSRDDGEYGGSAEREDEGGGSVVRDPP
jgi:hypothetical protein